MRLLLTRYASTPVWRALVDLITKTAEFKGKTALEWLQATDGVDEAAKKELVQLLTGYYPSLEQFID